MHTADVCGLAGSVDVLIWACFATPLDRPAPQIAPKANHVFVAKEELSLDVIAQYNVR